MHYTYAIGLASDLVEPYDNCYIGVTKNLWKRFREHRYKTPVVKDYIAQHGLTFDNMKVILESDDRNICFDLERKLRPYPNIGLNVSAGGYGGWTSNTPTGAKNVKAKQWRITDPNGIVHYIHGAFDIFCKENNILSGTLRRSKGPVEPLVAKFGGFRAKSQEHLWLRNNTTGWSLEVIERN